MQQRLSLITLGVYNLEATRKFYEEGLGWKLLHVAEDVAFYQMPGFALALFPFAQLAKDANLQFKESGENNVKNSLDEFRGMSLSYNAQSEKEVDELMSLAEKNGAKILKKSQKTFWGGYAGYFSDLNGHLWEVAYGTFYKVDENGATVFDFGK